MNLALLARQGWRIVTRQASLLYKILKGRYFRNSNFLNAKVGSNPSFGWRSLIEGRKVLKKEDGGIRWVSQLIKNKEWDKALVESLLGEKDVEWVLAIPLSKL
ncbi:hypothetical protein LIER_38387 [Lithospermum erythrorhizon]|uniref:Uncharacterized protein n=1 Tax=Lithospermum erythrorhizon TaxID=34254 RepID=A0AAV3Q1B1_LITER